MAENLLTITETSQLTGINPETLKKRCQSGSIPGAIKKGKTWLIPESSSLGFNRPKVGVYIDGPNLLHGGLETGWLIDYKKLNKFIKKDYNPVVLSYYDSVGHERDKKGSFIKNSDGKFIPRKGQLKFLNLLKGLGYRIVSPSLKYICGDMQRPKNTTDNHINWDVAKEKELWEQLFLFSGDSDFERLVDEVVALNKTVKIFSFSNRLSYELKIKAFNSPLVAFTELEKLKDILALPQKKK
ncbi:MAG: NYN domain-containing protein [Candidatus Nealsonbacteria bacterium]|nr:MAG: NYN domain-containing protein [Candidatus Nealsonbacteria bacterium]